MTFFHRIPVRHGVLIALITAGILPGLYFLTSLRVPAVINADSAVGFWVWDSMRAGAAFNQLREPSPADLTRDREVFIAWWSPGQYLLAAPWQLVGLNLGRAVALTALLSTWSALAGYWRLFLRLGFTPAASAGGLLLIATGWGTSHGFNMYLGGDVVLLGALPWLTLAGLKLANGSAARLAWWPLLFLVGAFLKLNFIIAAFGLTAFIYVERAGGWRKMHRRLALGLGLLAAVGAALFIVQWCFLRHGTTPVSMTPRPKSLSIALAFSSMGLFMSAFSISTLIDRLVLFPGAPLVQNFDDIDPWLWLLAPACGWVYVLARRHAPSRTYWNLLAALTVVFTLVFGWLYWRGNNVGFSDRYYRIGGYLLLPLIAQQVVAGGRWSRWFAAALASLSIGYGAVGYIQRTTHFARVANVGGRGFTQPNISTAALRALRKLDATLPAGDTIVLVPSVDIALEIQRHRRFSLPGLRTGSDQLRANHWNGRPKDGVIILLGPDMSNDGRLELVLAAFTAIPKSDWKRESIDGWTLLWDQPKLSTACRLAIADNR